MDRDIDNDRKSESKRSKWKTVVMIVVSISFVIIGLNLTQFGALIAFIILIFIGAVYISVYEVIRMIKDRNHTL